MRRWATIGRIETIRFSERGEQEKKKAEDRRKSYIYARVSSIHQKKDLDRQIEDLREAYPDFEVVSDIGSGLNFKRKGLRTILEQCFEGMVKQVVVMHKDRLCRYGTEILELLFKKTGTKLLVHSKFDEIDHNNTQELAEDLLAITTIFVARHNGQRSAENRRRRKRKREDETIKTKETEN